MSKMTSYILLMTGLIIFFYFFGLLEKTPSSTLLNMVLSPESTQNFDFWQIIQSSILGIGILGSVIIGIVQRDVILTVNTAIVTYLASLLFDFVAVYSKLHSANPTIAVIVFAPIIFLYIITVFEWWRGTA